MEFVDCIYDAYATIIKSVANSDGILSEKERDAIENLKDLCQKVLSMNESVQRLNEWKELTKEES